MWQCTPKSTAEQRKQGSAAQLRQHHWQGNSHQTGMTEQGLHGQSDPDTVQRHFEYFCTTVFSSSSLVRVEGAVSLAVEVAVVVVPTAPVMVVELQSW